MIFHHFLFAISLSLSVSVLLFPFSFCWKRTHRQRFFVVASVFYVTAIDISHRLPHCNPHTRFVAPKLWYQTTSAVVACLFVLDFVFVHLNNLFAKHLTLFRCTWMHSTLSGNTLALPPHPCALCNVHALRWRWRRLCKRYSSPSLQVKVEFEFNGTKFNILNWTHGWIILYVKENR